MSHYADLLVSPSAYGLAHFPPLQVIQRTALKKIGKSEDVASLVSYIVSKEAHYITGESQAPVLPSLVHIDLRSPSTSCRAIGKSVTYNLLWKPY